MVFLIDIGLVFEHWGLLSADECIGQERVTSFRWVCGRETATRVQQSPVASAREEGRLFDLGVGWERADDRPEGRSFRDIDTDAVAEFGHLRIAFLLGDQIPQIVLFGAIVVTVARLPKSFAWAVDVAVDDRPTDVGWLAGSVGFGGRFIGHTHSECGRFIPEQLTYKLQRDLFAESDPTPPPAESFAVEGLRVEPREHVKVAHRKQEHRESKWNDARGPTAWPKLLGSAEIRLGIAGKKLQA